jgi:chromosome segregation ATPase
MEPTVGELMAELDEAKAGGDRFEILSAGIRLTRRQAGHARFSIEMLEHRLAAEKDATPERRAYLTRLLDEDRRELRECEAHIAELERRRWEELDQRAKARRAPQMALAFGEGV